MIRFFLQFGIVTGQLTLPPGWTIDHCKFRLIPNGVPWFKPSEEVQAASMAIACGLSSPQRECEKIGTNAFENVDETAKLIKYAMEKHGMLIQFGSPKQEKITVGTERTTQGTLGFDENDQNETSDTGNP